MKKNTTIGILLITNLLIPAWLITSPVYKYALDLNQVVKDRYQVELDCSDFDDNNLIFHFPKIVPGTYEKADYGRFIKSLKAWDETGQQLNVKKQGKNTYIIGNSKNIQKITYWVKDSWDARWMLNRIYPMEGTNIEEGKNFVLNAGGVFGYFQDREDQPVELIVTKPAELYAMTALPQEKIANNTVLINAKSYHQLVDSPIMFAPPDTVSFNIKNTKVMIAVAHETNTDFFAEQIYQSIAPSLMAIGEYLDPLPADKYTFIMYFSDESEMGKILDNPRFLLFKALGYLIRHGIPIAGALEHNTSSFYYNMDPGAKYLDDMVEMLNGTVIHEFMHIISPLNLHSQYIGDFDYSDPEMSQHLWLYEGITEYFADLIPVRAGLISPKDYLLQELRSKISRGEKFPNEKMSFTEMSANILEKKYRKQFGQVYQRGAALGAMLDIEIIHLTDGDKTLIDVISELVERYGPQRSFDEDTFIDEFVNLVHPDLMLFFENYISGNEEIPYDKFLAQVGIEFHASITELRPRHPWQDTKSKIVAIGIGDFATIKKVGKDDFLGFEKGDRINRDFYYDLFKDEYGNYIPEGDTVHVPLIRAEIDISIPVVTEYIEVEASYKFVIKPEMTAQELKYFNTWLGIDKNKPEGLLE